jgi:hypothetical protein
MLFNEDELMRTLLRERQEEIRRDVARYRLLELPRGRPAPWRRWLAQVYGAFRRRPVRQIGSESDP